MNIFVYGTLKQGQSRERLLDGQRFLGEGCTLARYRMYNCGSYPGLVPDELHGRAIEGEVWDVDAACLKTLDEVEGVADGLYHRSTVELESPFDGQRAETYFYARSTTGLTDCGCRWT